MDRVLEGGAAHRSRRVCLSMEDPACDHKHIFLLDFLQDHVVWLCRCRRLPFTKRVQSAVAFVARAFHSPYNFLFYFLLGRHL
jgi:hypothetical protein